MSHELQVTDVSIHPYNLSVTTRKNEGDTTELMAELTYRTIAMWLHITKYLKQGVHKIEGGSVEQRFADEINKRMISDTDAPKAEPFEFKETFGDSRVTCWDTYRGAEHPCFHLNSDDNPQVAIDVWVAQGEGIRKALAKFGADTQQPAAPKPPVKDDSQAQWDAMGSEKPATPKNAPSDIGWKNEAIPAIRAPNSNRIDYADGQLVLFNINKIETGANKGSTIFKMWSALGTQFPTVTVYMKKPNGELKPDYQIIKPIIDTLGFSLEKTEASGNWQLMCKASTAGEKQYLNVVSLTAI